ncbi:von Willebrand factor C domain-containing protein 2-like [Ostrea edulis]|uniref:von Willebrand factor C domain-containing protein 2-like n=1 Tax=Ostrea edulis TaxID=37623 RepID=UPI0024AF67A6|nr:von Willebrand factor C domain-containing protein 2-like [Ostrea edulis]
MGSRKMLSALYATLYLTCVTSTWSSDSISTPPCLYRGQQYPVGSFQPSVCEHCQCSVSGQVTCAPQFCPPPECVDDVKDPSQCCPVCPNGKTCQITNSRTIIKFGERYFDGGMECRCPSHGSLEAECIYV